MSFRCQKCGEARPNAANPAEYMPQQVVTKTRTLAKRPGKEIVEQLRLCLDCAQRVGEPTNEVVH